MPYTLPGKKRPLGGGSSASTQGVPAAGAPATPSANSPGFVNFSRLLAVNQGGAQRMADTLAGKVQAQGQAAQNELESARTGFAGRVQQGTLNYQAPSFQRGASGTPASADLYRTAGALRAQAGRGYEGPKDWNAAGYNTAQLAERAKEAGAAAQNLTTAGGRGAMLRQGAGGGYSAGMSALDSALAGAALGSRDEDLARLYGGLSQRLIDYQRQGDEAVAGATTASNTAAQRYGQDAAYYQRLGDDSLASEEAANRYAEEWRRRYPGNPSLLTPGLWG